MWEWMCNIRDRNVIHNLWKSEGLFIYNHGRTYKAWQIFVQIWIANRNLCVWFFFLIVEFFLVTGFFFVVFIFILIEFEMNVYVVIVLI